MRAKWFAMAVMAMLVTAGAAYASEVGNNPEGAGFRFDFGFERTQTEVELKDPAIVYSAVDSGDEGDYYWTESYTETFDSFDGRETMDKYFLKLAYGFGDKYSLYAKVGMARLATEAYNLMMIWDYEYDEYDAVTDEHVYEYYNYDQYLTEPTRGMGDWDLFYGAGFKAVFYDAGGFKVGMDLQYNQYQLDSEYYMYYDDYAYGYGPPDAPTYWYIDTESQQVVESDTTEYQAALVFSKKNDKFSPYGGIKFSQVETDYTGEYCYHYENYYGDIDEESGAWTLTTTSKDTFGVFVGADYEMTAKFAISGEFQLGDQTATAIKMTWKF